MNTGDSSLPLPPEVQAAKVELLALRCDVDAAEARLFHRAAEVEQVIGAAVWKSYFGSYDGFLEKSNICDSSRYRSFMAAFTTTGIAADADRMGVSATIEAARIADEGRRAAYCEAARTRAEETGVPWSDQEAKHQRLRIAGSEPRNSNWNKVATEKTQLRQEVIELKRKLQAAEIEIAELQEENERLRAADKKKGRSRPDDQPKV